MRLLPVQFGTIAAVLSNPLSLPVCSFFISYFVVITPAYMPLLIILIFVLHIRACTPRSPSLFLSLISLCVGTLFLYWYVISGFFLFQHSPRVNPPSSNHSFPFVPSSTVLFFFPSLHVVSCFALFILQMHQTHYPGRFLPAICRTQRVSVYSICFFKSICFRLLFVSNLSYSRYRRSITEDDDGDDDIPSSGTGPAPPIPTPRTPTPIVNTALPPRPRYHTLLYSTFFPTVTVLSPTTFAACWHNLLNYFTHRPFTALFSFSTNHIFVFAFCLKTLFETFPVTMKHIGGIYLPFTFHTFHSPTISFFHVPTQIQSANHLRGRRGRGRRLPPWIAASCTNFRACVTDVLRQHCHPPPFQVHVLPLSPFHTNPDVSFIPQRSLSSRPFIQKNAEELSFIPQRSLSSAVFTFFGDYYNVLPFFALFYNARTNFICDHVYFFVIAVSRYYFVIAVCHTICCLYALPTLRPLITIVRVMIYASIFLPPFQVHHPCTHP